MLVVHIGMLLVSTCITVRVQSVWGHAMVFKEQHILAMERSQSCSEIHIFLFCSIRFLQACHMHTVQDLKPMTDDSKALNGRSVAICLRSAVVCLTDINKVVCTSIVHGP